MKTNFLTNYSNVRFIDKLKESLSKCSEFRFSVSFIKKRGLALIEKDIIGALERGAKGSIITSTYQNFTDIPSLEFFYDLMLKYQNFECHIDYHNFGENGFHSKGYLFFYDDEFEFLIGSTNITTFALEKNVEWNVAVCKPYSGEDISLILNEFEYLWKKTSLLDTKLIEMYSSELEYAIVKWDMDYVIETNKIVRPNKMQIKALMELQRYRDIGADKALIISATGSGKTYLAAFDARNFGASRVLFIVHRETILLDAIKTFTKVFGSNKSYGLFTGKEQSLDCDFIFASSSMLARHLNDFSPNEFDYIVFDEAHHTVADGGMKIIEYFKPNFLLGITATGDRLDNKDVYEVFDHNMPYELTIRDGILEGLIVPFHYYAIHDSFADYSANDKAKISREIARLENIEFISNQINKHKPKEQKLKAIAFCCSVEHSKTMARELEMCGFHTVSLTGFNDTGERIKAFKDLQDDSKELQIICTVDILNEGVDIPAINMVMFLRPTESPTIFLQQLGRGLRTYKDKDFVTVLDFIGNNYERSVQIAMALGTLDKDIYIEKQYLKKMVETDFKSLDIPGIEIFFDDLSKQDIIKYIDNQNFNRLDFLRKDYLNFKEYLKCESYPSHMDYINCEYSPNLLRFMKAMGGSKRSYYEFLLRIKEDVPLFNEKQIMIINKLSDELPLVRADEFLIVRSIILGEEFNLSTIDEKYKNITSKSIELAYNHLKYKDIQILDSNNILNCDISEDFSKFLLDLIEYGLCKLCNDLSDQMGTFSLYFDYKKPQIVNLLGHEYRMDLKQKGTIYEDNGITVLLVDLKKDKSKKEKILYKDKFLDKSKFQWESKTNVTVDNSEGTRLLNTKKTMLFVKKMDEEDGIKLPYKYFGTGHFENARKSYVRTKKQDGSYVDSPTLLFDVILDNEVPNTYFIDFEIEELE